MSPEFTTAPNDGQGEGLYIKRSGISRYSHPNIVRYHGCRVRRGRVTGIVIDRHDAVLNTVENDHDLQSSLDRDRIMADIEAAVALLHSLGLAHNDLNPANIVIGKSKEAILIDFGSCQPFGKELVSMGTPGWYDEDFTSSAKEHDLTALTKIKTWLDNVYEGRPTGLPTMPLDGIDSKTIEERGLL